MKAENYRKPLGKYIGRKIDLECSRFKVEVDENMGRYHILLFEPFVAKIDGRRLKGKLAIDHLWVKIPPGNCALTAKAAELACKICITGTICEYQYAVTGLLQAGVKADVVKVLKLRKEIARRYNLSANYAPAEESIKRIVKQENVRSAIDHNKGTSTGSGAYDMQMVTNKNDKRHVDIIVSNLMEQLHNLDYDGARAIASKRISNLDEYYVFVKVKNGECIGYGKISFVDKSTLEASCEFYAKYHSQQIEKDCVAIFAHYLNSKYKTTNVLFRDKCIL